MKLVKQIATRHHIAVSNAMAWIGYEWKYPKCRPTNIHRMLEGVPRIHLVQILNHLKEIEAGK